MVLISDSRSRHRRQHAGAVARVNAGFLDVLHDAGDQHVLAVAERVDIDFDGVFEEAVDQHGAVLREGDGFAHVAAHAVFVVDDHHGAAAEHVAGAHQHRIADALRDLDGFVGAGRRAVCGRGNLQVVEQFAEELAVFGEIDVLGIGADDRHAEPLQRQRESERRLPAELHDHAVGLFGVDDVQHVFERERLEVEAVAGVVIGRDGLGIAVDHDRFDVFVLQRERRVAAAVIELDSLADAVGSAAQNHDLFAIVGVGFAGGFVGGIEIRREAFEFGRAGIDAIEDGAQRPVLCGARALRSQSISTRWRSARRRCPGAWLAQQVGAVRGCRAIRLPALCSNSTVCRSCSRNHGSIAVISWISLARCSRSGRRSADS